VIVGLSAWIEGLRLMALQRTEPEASATKVELPSAAALSAPRAAVCRCFPPGMLESHAHRARQPWLTKGPESGSARVWRWLCWLALLGSGRFADPSLWQRAREPAAAEQQKSNRMERILGQSNLPELDPEMSAAAIAIPCSVKPSRLAPRG